MGISTKHTILTLAVLISCKFEHYEALPRPQGIPFFYVDGNPFKEILFQHKIVQSKGLEGWVWVDTPEEKLQAEPRSSKALDLISDDGASDTITFPASSFSSTSSNSDPNSNLPPIELFRPVDGARPFFPPPVLNRDNPERDSPVGSKKPESGVPGTSSEPLFVKPQSQMKTIFTPAIYEGEEKGAPALPLASFTGDFEIPFQSPSEDTESNEIEEDNEALAKHFKSRGEAENLALKNNFISKAVTTTTMRNPFLRRKKVEEAAPPPGFKVPIPMPPPLRPDFTPVQGFFFNSNGKPFNPTVINQNEAIQKWFEVSNAARGNMAHRKFIGTINNQGPPFLVNFKILPQFTSSPAKDTEEAEESLEDYEDYYDDYLDDEASITEAPADHVIEDLITGEPTEPPLLEQEVITSTSVPEREDNLNDSKESEESLESASSSEESVSSSEESKESSEESSEESNGSLRVSEVSSSEESNESSEESNESSEESNESLEESNESSEESNESSEESNESSEEAHESSEETDESSEETNESSEEANEPSEETSESSEESNKSSQEINGSSEESTESSEETSESSEETNESLEESEDISTEKSKEGTATSSEQIEKDTTTETNEKSTRTTEASGDEVSQSVTTSNSIHGLDSLEEATTFNVIKAQNEESKESLEEENENPILSRSLDQDIQSQVNVLRKAKAIKSGIAEVSNNNIFDPSQYEYYYDYDDEDYVAPIPVDAGIQVTPQNSLEFKCSGDKLGYFPSVTNCRSYHVCLPSKNGRFRHWEFECGPGTVFSPKHLACVHNNGRICGRQRHN